MGPEKQTDGSVFGEAVAGLFEVPEEADEGDESSEETSDEGGEKEDEGEQ